MMKHKNLITCLLIITMLFYLNPVVAYGDNKKVNENSGISVEARSAILIEPKSGTIIYEKNSNEKFAPASVTKIMTMLLTMEAIDSGKMSLNDKVTCSENAKKMGGSTMFLETGEIRTIEELLKGVGIASGNDAAVALAEYVGGTEENFADMMNKRAAELGMKNTSFKNCTGLPANGHLSTAYDISIMSRELLKHPTILKYTGTYMETISEGRKSPIELVNHNKLVRFLNGCDGLKTGYTEEAKYCISATAVKDGVRMLSVIMGAPSWKVRNRDASMLINYGFGKFMCKKVVSKGQELEKVPLDKKGKKFFIIQAKDDLTLVLPREGNKEITKKINIDIPKDKKVIKKGETIGNCEFYLNNKLIGKVPICSDRDVKKGIFHNFFEGIKNIFDCVV